MSKYVKTEPKPFAAVMRHKRSKDDYVIVLEYFYEIWEANNYIWNIRNKDPDFIYEVAMYV
jgi:hypothetical protein